MDKSLIWEHVEDSMLYPGDDLAIPYFLWAKGNSPRQYKMILGIDAPASLEELLSLINLATHEFEGICGMWTGEALHLIETRMIEFDAIFANECAHAREAKTT